MAVAGIVVTAIATIALLQYMSTPQFRSAWNDFCAGIIGLLSKLWGWIKSLFMSAAKAVENAVSKSLEKATDIIRKKRWSEYYWIASSVDFKKKNSRMTTYFPCAPISFNNAKQYVRCGGNVFASCQASARKLAYAIGNGNVPIGPEKHGGLGYFWHYHAHRHVGGHIFYIF